MQEPKRTTIQQFVHDEIVSQLPDLLERFLSIESPDPVFQEGGSPYDPIQRCGRTYISLDAFSQFITDFSGEHAPCVFEEIYKSWGGGKCDGRCCNTHNPSCWGAYMLWWMERRKENE